MAQNKLRQLHKKKLPVQLPKENQNQVVGIVEEALPLHLPDIIGIDIVIDQEVEVEAEVVVEKEDIIDNG